LKSWSRWRTGYRLASGVGENRKALEVDVIVPVFAAQDAAARARIQQERPGKRLKLPQQGVLLQRKRPGSDKHLLTSNESGRRFVVLLPHLRAAKLTSGASYW
jgi:hypothetical protein